MFDSHRRQWGRGIDGHGTKFGLCRSEDKHPLEGQTSGPVLGPCIGDTPHGTVLFAVSTTLLGVTLLVGTMEWMVRLVALSMYWTIHWPSDRPSWSTTWATIKVEQ